MTWEEQLEGITSFYIDTAPFIYFLESNPLFVDSARNLFTYFRTHDSNITTSVVTLTEVLVKPLASANTELEYRYRVLLERTSKVMLVAVSRDIADKAAHLRAQYGIRTPDALHLATALHMGCQVFITNDEMLKRVTDLQVITLRDVPADSKTHP